MPSIEETPEFIIQLAKDQRLDAVSIPNMIIAANITNQYAVSRLLVSPPYHVTFSTYSIFVVSSAIILVRKQSFGDAQYTHYF